jgi:hypothetical protein
MPLAIAVAVTVVGLFALSPSVARAQPMYGHAHWHGGVVVGGFYGPYYSPFYSPFWGYGWGPYPYAAWAPYGYGYAYEPSSSARIQVDPKDARVYVDGYYAGKVDDFDGTFQRLNVRPGPHQLTIFKEGYRTISEKLYMSDGSTVKFHEAMDKLAPGEKSEPPPTPPAPRPRSRDRSGDGSAPKTDD